MKIYAPASNVMDVSDPNNARTTSPLKPFLFWMQLHLTTLDNKFLPNLKTSKGLCSVSCL